MGNDKKALIALMDLVLALADALEAPTATQRGKAMERVRDERQEIAGWHKALVTPTPEEIMEGLEQIRATGRQDGATRLRQELAVSQDGQAARTAVAATERRMRAWYGLEGLEADDNRLTQPFSLTHEARLARDPEYAAAWATECAAELDKRPSRRGHKRYGGKPGCGCSVCQCARSVGG